MIIETKQDKVITSEIFVNSLLLLGLALLGGYLVFEIFFGA